MALSHVVSEIINVEEYGDLEIPIKSQSKSLKVVPFDRLYICFYSNFVPMFGVKNTVLKTVLGVRQGH